MLSRVNCAHIERAEAAGAGGCFDDPPSESRPDEQGTRQLKNARARSRCGSMRFGRVALLRFDCDDPRRDRVSRCASRNAANGTDGQRSRCGMAAVCALRASVLRPGRKRSAQKSSGDAGVKHIFGHSWSKLSPAWTVDAAPSNGEAQRSLKGREHRAQRSTPAKQKPDPARFKSEAAAVRTASHHDRVSTAAACR